MLTDTIHRFTVVLMGRIKQMIAVDGRECWTLFDSGARNTYVISAVAKLLQTSPTLRAMRTALGGGIKEVNTQAILNAVIEEHPVSTYALVLNDIGKDQEGKPIEILFGAFAMQQWGIKLIPLKRNWIDSLS